MKAMYSILISALALTPAGASCEVAQSAPVWTEVRIATYDSWHGPAMDMVVRSFTLLEFPNNPFGAYGAFIGNANVEFTGKTATDFETGINADNGSLAFVSDTILPPGTRVHLEPLDRLSVPACADVGDPSTETCMGGGGLIFRTVWVLVR